MAASISTRKAPTRRTQPVAISERNVAVPTPSGTAMSMAINDVTTVPKTNARAPNCRWLGSGSQVVLVKNLPPIVALAGRLIDVQDAPGRAADRVGILPGRVGDRVTKVGWDAGHGRVRGSGDGVQIRLHGDAFLIDD